MHDFACSDPSDMYYDVLADRVRFFKEEKEGIAVMCKAMEDMRRESMQEGIKAVSYTHLSILLLSFFFLSLIHPLIEPPLLYLSRK